MSLITRKQKIIKRFVQEVETSAEITFTDDEGLFKIDMSKYPLIAEHLVLPKTNYIFGYSRASELFKLGGEFGYTFWDRSDRVYFDKSYEDDIVSEYDQETHNPSNYIAHLEQYKDSDGEYEFSKLYTEVEAESKALLQEFEDQIKKQISYYQDIKWDIEDSGGLKENLSKNISKKFWEDNINLVTIDVDEEIDIDMFEAQVNNMRAMLDRNPSIRMYGVVQDGLRELWNDFTRKDKHD